MKQLKYFILGMISIMWIVPITEKILEVIFLWIETLKIKPTKKIMQSQKDTMILREFLSVPKVETDYDVEYVYGDEDEE